MVSRSRKVAKAFGNTGVLAKATQASPEAIGEVRDDFAPYWDSNGTYLDRPTYSAIQEIENSDSAGGRILNRITLSPTAVDPEGFPLTYTVDTIPVNPAQLDSVSVTGNNFVFTPAFGINGDSQNNEGTFKARLRASDGPRDVLDVVTFTLGYKEEVFQPLGTTRKLAMTFNGGAQGKTGDYSVTTNGTGISYSNQTGGTLNSGYATGFAYGSTFQITEFANVNSGRNHTLICWYKGTQTDTTGSVYQPAIVFFGDITGGAFLGFGLEGGKIYISGSSTKAVGTTNVADNNWNMCAFTYTTGDVCEGYVGAGGTLTKEISNKDVSGSTAYNRVDYIGAGYPYSGAQGVAAMDAVQIYQGILTQAQIQKIYDKGRS